MRTGLIWALILLPTPFHSATKQFLAVQINNSLEYKFPLWNED
jgi:hypothetical protein